MIGYLPTQALAFLAVFIYATHSTQAIAFGWKPGFNFVLTCTMYSDDASEAYFSQWGAIIYRQMW